MKRIVIAGLILALLCGVACAENDFSGKTAEELLEIISLAGTALCQLEPVDDSELLYSEQGFSVSIDSMDYDEKHDEIEIRLLRINDTDDEARFHISEAYVNGWQVKTHFNSSVQAKSKSRKAYTSISKICELAGIKDFSEIESIEAFGNAKVNGSTHKMHYVFAFDGKELRMVLRESAE